MAEETEKPSLFDVLEAEKQAEQQAEQPEAENEQVEATEEAPQEEQATEEVIEEVVEETAPEPQEEQPTTEDEPEEAKEGEEEKELSPLGQQLSSMGHDVTGLTDEEIQEEIKLLLAGSEEKNDAIPPDMLPPVKEEEKDLEAEPESGEEPKLKPLESIDSALPYVTFNEKNVAIPKEEFGDKAVAAAKKINDYNEARTERLNSLVNNPLEYLSDDFDKLVAERVKAALEAEKAAQAQAQQAEAAKSAEAIEYERRAKFFEEHQAELFAVNEDGTVKEVGLANKRRIPTDLGKAMEEEFTRLSALAPNAATSDLLQASYETAKRLAGEPAKKEVVEEKASEVKRKVLKKSKKRTSSQPPASNDSKASPEQRQEAGERVSMLQLIRESGELDI